MEGEKMYTKTEIVAATQKLFGKKYTPALVEAALKSSKSEKFTVDEAKKIVEEFAEQKIER